MQKNQTKKRDEGKQKMGNEPRSPSSDSRLGWNNYKTKTQKENE